MAEWALAHFFYSCSCSHLYRDTLLQTITEVITSLLNVHGAELVELKLSPQRGRWLVRIFVDAEDGVSLDDCRKLSYEIGQVLDAEELIPTAYLLEVSSPGLDRPLRTPRDFRRQHRHLVTVFLHTSLLGATEYKGRVADVTETQLVLHQPPEKPLEIPWTQVDHGVVEIEFK